MDICFTGRLSNPFVRKDYEMLCRHYDVDVLNPPTNKIDWLTYRFKAKKKVQKCDVTFSWFAVKYTAPVIYYSKKYNKKSIVIVGGQDAAYVPEINYGVFTNPVTSFVASYIYRNTDKALVVDSSLKKDISKNTGLQGDNIAYLPMGYDPDFFKPNGEKENIVLTVGNLTEPVIKRKGLEVFVRAAKYFPEVRFVVIGKYADGSYLTDIAPSNVEFPGFVPLMDDISWYQRSRVYCQLSRYEGLPNALCEAMLCECIPVGTRYCGIQTAIGDTGFYVPYGDVEATVEAIRKALRAPDEVDKKARERIMELFPWERREKGLVNVIEKGYVED